MYGFASYDIVRARQALAAQRAAQVAVHTDAVRAWRRAQTLRVRAGHAPAPAVRPLCCAA